MRVSERFTHSLESVETNQVTWRMEVSQAHSRTGRGTSQVTKSERMKQVALTSWKATGGAGYAMQRNSTSRRQNSLPIE
jgi:hypothetical protein